MLPRRLRPWKPACASTPVRWAHRAARWTGPYPLVTVTLLVGAVLVSALTAASVEIYEAVAEADGAAALDEPVLQEMTRLRSPGINSAVTAYTDLGGPVGMPVLAAAAAGSLAVRARRWTPLVLTAIAAAGSLLMTVVGKSLVGRMRPPLTEAVPPYESSSAFPSGHALNAVVIAGIIAYLLVQRQRHRSGRVITVLAAAGFAATMGLSRVFLGHHWLTDVLMAWTLGLTWLALVVLTHRLHLAVRHVRRAHRPGARSVTEPSRIR